MQRLIRRILVLALPVAILTGPLRAEDPSGNGNAPAANGSTVAKAKHATAVAKKDPVKAAFALPRGITLDNLRPDQQEAYQKLKDRMEPKFRDALENVRTAADEKAKTAAAHDAIKMRREIRGDILSILNQPDPKVVKQVQNALRNAMKHRHRVPYWRY